MYHGNMKERSCSYVANISDAFGWNIGETFEIGERRTSKCKEGCVNDGHDGQY